MLISLTQGMRSRIDVENSDLSYINWHVNMHGRNVYAVGRVSGKLVKMHRLIMSRKLGRELNKTEIVDHINGNGLDNRLLNLRIVDKRENACNRYINGGMKSSKYKGVSFNKSAGKWSAHITNDGKRHYLGLFVEEEAAEAYDKASISMHGRHGYLNFPTKRFRKHIHKL